MKTETKRKDAESLGVGAAAYIACCAAPLLGVVAAAGTLPVGGVVAGGAVGLAILRRRRR